MKTTTVIIGLTLAVAGAAHGQFFPERDPADVNGDGLINAADLAEVMGKWGKAEQPWAAVLERCPDPNVVTNEELRQAIVATGLPWRVVDIGTGIEMLLVPPGTFMMGCSASDEYGCGDDELPIHEVTLTKAFYLGRYEVTQSQWTAVMGTNPSIFRDDPDSPSRPVEKVSWYTLQGFEAATGLRLPTEAEWEYAARAGTSTAFNNGMNDASQLGSIAWFGGNSKGQTHAVGQLSANAFGLHDMHGNVAEWCEDWYDGEYYANSPATDPPGPVTGNYHVFRGGSWWVTNIDEMRISDRGASNFNYFWLGFRAARNP